jgi:uncharacterized repeat protein (TIGR03943 family)
MTEEQTRSLLLVVLGAMVVWLWWSGQALNYVRPGLAPWLLGGGVVVGLLGLLPPLGLLGRETAQADHGGHHQHRGRVGWLLLVPVLVVILVQPAALGSYAAASRSAVPEGGGHEGGFQPLAAPVRGAVPMPMAEFVTRAVRDPDQSLAGVRVRLVGFVAPSQGQEGGYRLTRFVIFCCAADAEALQAVVRGDATPRARDQWLQVEGTWQPRPPAAEDDPSPPPPALHADLVRPVAPTRPPYEYTVQFSG